MSSDAIQTAVNQLGRSATGRWAMKDLLAFLDGAGLSLDATNKEAVLTLLSAAWDQPGATRDLMRAAID